jgi:hypothetical protein
MTYLKRWSVCARAFRVMLILAVHLSFFSFQDGEPPNLWWPDDFLQKIQIKPCLTLNFNLISVK